MAQIKLKQPNSDYEATVDTGVMDVEIRRVYVGVTFINERGDTLVVSQRDNGWEVNHTSVDGNSEYQDVTITTDVKKEDV